MPQSSSRGDSGPESAGPLGGGPYLVEQGDCLESIAFARGLLWKTVWNAPENADLKNARNSNILLPGDRLFIPAIRPKLADCAVDQKHQFIREGVSSRLRVRVFEWVWPDSARPGEDAPAEVRPRSDVPYALQIDGSLISGYTDGDGWIDTPISPGARGGSLTLEPGTPQSQRVSLVLGGLDPAAADSGVSQRLANLGFDPNTTDRDSDEFKDAVSTFQAALGIEATGTLDDDTMKQLNSMHCS